VETNELVRPNAEFGVKENDKRLEFGREEVDISRGNVGDTRKLDDWGGESIIRGGECTIDNSKIDENKFYRISFRVRKIKLLRL